MERNPYTSITEILTTDSQILEQAKPGLCRMWVKKAINLINERFPQVEAEAREVEVGLQVFHAFLKIQLPNERTLYLDAIGAEKFQPFIGYEEDLPIHLQNSHSDMMNSYLKKSSLWFKN